MAVESSSMTLHSRSIKSVQKNDLEVVKKRRHLQKLNEGIELEDGEKNDC